jgi:hypothetical protein
MIVVLIVKLFCKRDATGSGTLNCGNGEERGETLGRKFAKGCHKNVEAGLYFWLSGVMTMV